MSATELSPNTATMEELDRAFARVSNLSHVEIRTPKIEESLEFFTDIVGLVETERHGQSVYLRCVGDFTHHTLVLTEAKKPGIEHLALRLVRPEHVDIFARRLRDAGLTVEEVAAGTERGQGDAIRFKSPFEHTFELFHDFDRPVPQKASLLRNQPEAYHGRGVTARRIDHVNLFTPDIAVMRGFLQQNLDFKLRESIEENDGTELGSWMSVTVNVHDIALTLDRRPAETRNLGSLHHLGFYVDTREKLLEAADLMSERQIFIEAGPAKHGITQAFFMYVYEPGGNRIELFSGGYQIFEPDWQTVTWTEAEFKRAIIWWGADLPESYMAYAT
jgi:catechol 2,3-dioxygenase